MYESVHHVAVCCFLPKRHKEARNTYSIISLHMYLHIDTFLIMANSAQLQYQSFVFGPSPLSYLFFSHSKPSTNIKIHRKIQEIAACEVVTKMILGVLYLCETYWIWAHVCGPSCGYRML